MTLNFLQHVDIDTLFKSYQNYNSITTYDYEL